MSGAATRKTSSRTVLGMLALGVLAIVPFGPFLGIPGLFWARRLRPLTPDLRMAYWLCWTGTFVLPLAGLGLMNYGGGIFFGLVWLALCYRLWPPPACSRAAAIAIAVGGVLILTPTPILPVPLVLMLPFMPEDFMSIPGWWVIAYFLGMTLWLVPAHLALYWPYGAKEKAPQGEMRYVAAVTPEAAQEETPAEPARSSVPATSEILAPSADTESAAPAFVQDAQPVPANPKAVSPWVLAVICLCVASVAYQWILPLPRGGLAGLLSHIPVLGAFSPLAVPLALLTGVADLFLDAFNAQPSGRPGEPLAAVAGRLAAFAFFWFVAHNIFRGLGLSWLNSLLQSRAEVDALIEPRARRKREGR